MNKLKQWHEHSLKIEDALRHLYLVETDARLYTDNHPKFQQTLRAAAEAWEELLKDYPEVELKQIGPELIFQNIALQGHLKTTRDFAESMKDRGIECLVVKRGLTTRELVEYAHYMRLSETHRKQVGDAQKYLQDRGVHNIEFWQLGDMRGARTGSQGGAIGLPIALKDLRAFRRSSLKIIDNLCQKVRVAQVLDLNVAEEIVDHFLKEATTHSSIVLGLSSIRSADEYTSTHSLNVCLLAVCLAKYLGVSDNQLRQVGIAGLLHDIGKMFVPLEILNKPGRLEPEEWKIMQHHTTFGARFLLSVPGLPRIAPLVAYEHHMNLKGTGYPRAPKTYRVNLISLITSIADFYDALSTSRPYRRAIPPAKVVEIMVKTDGDGKMEPRILHQFLRMLGRYPVGTLVRIDTGELGVVSMQNPEDPLRPEIQLVAAPDGTRIDPCVAVDLTEKDNEDEYLRSVVEPVDPMEVEIEPLEVLQKVLDSELPELAQKNIVDPRVRDEIKARQ